MKAYLQIMIGMVVSMIIAAFMWGMLGIFPVILWSGASFMFGIMLQLHIQHPEN